MRTVIIAASAAAALFSSPAFTQQPSRSTASIPDFSGIWGHLVFPDVEPPLSGAGPVRNLSRVTIEVARTLAPYNGSANESEARGDNENFRFQVSDTGLARNPNYKGPGLMLEFTVEDQGVFTTPWSARITYRPPLGSWPEFVCAESTRDYVGRTISLPHADKPDF
jgi:hypothetical protein